jgi:phosphopantetheinyl transferase (holo-ACP synthase)
MTRNEANQYLAVILETVAKAGKSGAPNGYLYAAFNSKGMTLDEYQMLISLAKSGELIEESNHLLTITDKGREMVAKIALKRTG